MRQNQRHYSVKSTKNHAKLVNQISEENNEQEDQNGSANVELVGFEHINIYEKDQEFL